MRNYTPEQLQQNYDKFIEAIKKVFRGDRLEKLLHMDSENELGTELALAPASGKLNFHSAYVGGYIDHVMNVARNAYKLKKMFEDKPLEELKSLKFSSEMDVTLKVNKPEPTSTKVVKEGETYKSNGVTEKV